MKITFKILFLTGIMLFSVYFEFLTFQRLQDLEASKNKLQITT